MGRRASSVSPPPPPPAPPPNPHRAGQHQMKAVTPLLLIRLHRFQQALRRDPRRCLQLEAVASSSRIVRLASSGRSGLDAPQVQGRPGPRPRPRRAVAAKAGDGFQGMSEVCPRFNIARNPSSLKSFSTILPSRQASGTPPAPEGPARPEGLGLPPFQSLEQLRVATRRSSELRPARPELPGR